mmetsp:Transcript_15955/g.17696  ORF Transcript_15955/g.17696 Transcript_15955/m.17696 type:complete len:114 (-) Transcript_15955:71-412(-)
MKINVNNHSDIKLNESIELEKFNQEKMNDCILHRESRDSKGSRHSDLEQPDVFRPTISSCNGQDTLFDKNSKVGEEVPEGVDDYDGEPKANRSAMVRSGKRSSLSDKYRFEGV